MDDIATHYKELIPTLKCMKIKSDGCRSQYKGRKNFMALGRSHLKDHGVLQLHDFPASHHYGGPHDNAGKVPRIRMSQDEAFEAGKVMQLQYQWPTIMCAIVPNPMCVLSCLVLSCLFVSERIYNYHCCYEFCVKYLSEPSNQRQDKKGTWGCNGKHFWQAFSNGTDIYRYSTHEFSCVCTVLYS